MTDEIPGLRPAEPPLSAPYYRAPLPAALRRFFQKYATFNGRASRAEYWWWVLVATLFGIGVQVVYGLATGDWRSDASTPTTTNDVVLLATLIPSLALTWRRLHDVDRSGVWFFFGLIPVVGWITLFVFTVLPANGNGARFDKRPHNLRAHP